MSQRVAKVESLIQQVVALAVTEQFGPAAARITVTRVDAAPDLRNATVWFGLLGAESEQEQTMEDLNRYHSEFQSALAKKMVTKFVPHLHFRADTGGAYAAEIDRLLKDL